MAGALKELTPHELRIAQLVSEGKKGSEIVAILFISPQTVKNHKHTIFEKTGVRNSVELCLWYLRHTGKLKVE